MQYSEFQALLQVDHGSGVWNEYPRKFNEYAIRML